MGSRRNSTRTGASLPITEIVSGAGVGGGREGGRAFAIFQEGLAGLWAKRLEELY